jgi:hypothetical protein
MDALFSGIATYFSANFLVASIANSFYFSKAKKDKTKDDAPPMNAKDKARQKLASKNGINKFFSIEHSDGKQKMKLDFDQLKSQFREIKFSTMWLVLDPLLTEYLCCFKSCFKKRWCFKR